MKQSTGTSWGRYPSDTQTLHATNWRGELHNDLIKASTNGNTLAYGNGRSYGDSCLAESKQALAMRGLDRFIAVNWENGVICAEAGVTLGEILALTIPHGWFLPVTPGTQYVTLGGAVANDVHGKNHHKRGTLGCHVTQFSLVRSDSAPMICSPSQQKELFAATIGGLGLTGIIEWVELQLMPIASSRVNTTNIRFESLDEFFSLSQTLDNQHEYSVAWIDCLAKGASLGRGIFTVGDHATEGTLNIHQQRKITIPFTPPISVINHMTLKAFNWAYYHQQKEKQKQTNIYYEPFFYPLDKILQWNRLYGRKGFQQYQCVIPENAKSAIGELLRVIAANEAGSFLAVMKRCGDIASPGLLSFPMPGISLALDFPQQTCLETLFFHLDAIVREAGGRLYPAKDAHMSGADFRKTYPLWEQVNLLRDPLLCSQFWRRVIS